MHSLLEKCMTIVYERIKSIKLDNLEVGVSTVDFVQPSNTGFSGHGVPTDLAKTMSKGQQVAFDMSSGLPVLVK